MNDIFKAYLFVALTVSSPFGWTVPTAGAQLARSTFLGGSDLDYGWGIVRTSSGHTLIVGHTKSSDFPTTAGILDSSHNGLYDVFIVQLDSTGTSLVYATLLGGVNSDYCYDLDADASGCVYVTGHTESSDFPTTVQAYDSILNGLRDIFVAKLDPTGSLLHYSTFLGGSRLEQSYGIAVDDAGRATITGATSSFDFPTTANAYDPVYNGCGDDAVVTTLNADGDSLVYSTFLGGSSLDIGYDIAADVLGNIFVTGATASFDFPTTANAYDTSHNGSHDAFVAKLNPSGGSLIYATFLGGNISDKGTNIRVDASGNCAVIGTTESSDFPTTTAAFDITHNGGCDVFLIMLSAPEYAPIFSSFLGGGGHDCAYGIVLDETGCVYATGSTESADLPTSFGAYDTGHNGGEDAFVVKFNALGSDLLYSSFLGGSSSDAGLAIATDGSGNVYLTGSTLSADFPITTGAFDSIHNGNKDVFAAALYIAPDDPHPPEAVVDLTITLSQEDLVLRWSPVTADTNGGHLVPDFYYIYRDTLSSLDFDGHPFDSTQDVFYMDSSGAVGDTDVHHYYQVTAQYKGKESQSSKQVGEIDKYLSH